jgi:RNA polymerase sigma-70 factor (ECF subfamily)
VRFLTTTTAGEAPDEKMMTEIGRLVELNRAVAVGMAFGPVRGLALTDALASRPELRNYHLLPSVRGDFLAKLGRHEEARGELNLRSSCW